MSGHHCTADLDSQDVWYIDQVAAQYRGHPQLFATQSRSGSDRRHLLPATLCCFCLLRTARCTQGIF